MKIELENLKDCPLCGKKDLIVDTEFIPLVGGDSLNMGFIECATKDCPMIIRESTVEKAVEKWNKRPREDYLEDQNKALAEQLVIDEDVENELRKKLQIAVDALGRISDSVVGIKDYSNNTSFVNDALEALTKIKEKTK